MANGKLARWSSGLAGVVVVLVILAAANWLLRGVLLRVDLTEDRLYTLSDSTRNLLRGLERDVELQLFYSRSHTRLPPRLKTFAAEVQDLLKEFALASGGRVTVKTFDPAPDSDAEDWARKFGVTPQQVDLLSPELYFGLVALSGGEQAVLPALHPNNDTLMEYHILRLVDRAANPRRPIVGVLSSLPVLGSTPPPFMMPGQPRPQPTPPWIAFQDLKQSYDVREVPPTTATIDPDIHTLVLVHPKNLGEPTLFAIDQFLLRGGRLVAFLDTLCTMDESGGGQFGPPQSFSNLERLLGAWGLSFGASEVVADLKATTRLRRGDDPTCLSLGRDAGQFAAGDVVTSKLNALLLPFAGAFSGSPVAGLTLTPLLRTSPDAGTVSSFMAQMSLDAILREFKNGQRPLDLAVRLHGTFPTAFPDGRPTGAEDDDDEGLVGPLAPPLRESSEPSTVVLVGDVDMLADQFCVQTFNMFGATAYQPFNDNLSFFGNVIEQLSGSEQLVNIRTRGRTERPFTRVDAIEMEAQKRWMDEEKRLQAKLDETREQLRALETEKQDGMQRLVLSPEQAQAIQRFKDEEAATARALKDVRKNLRRSIEQLGAILKALNMLAMPLAVALAGIGFGLYRRAHTK